MDIEQVLGQLELVRKASSGGWTARCPAHDDRNPSLSVAEGRDGKVLLHCHAGCEYEAIADALGVRGGSSVPAAVRPVRPIRSRSKGEPIAELTARHERQGRVTEYEYRRPDGSVAFVVHRIDRPDAADGKLFRPMHESEPGRFSYGYGCDAGQRTLYRSDELAERPDELVLVVEGERCADAVAALGLLATTSAGGSAAGHLADWSALAGRDVVILTDADPMNQQGVRPGDKYGETVADKLRRVAASVRIVRLYDPDERPGGDVADWIAERGAADQDTIRTELLDAIQTSGRVPDSIGVEPISRQLEELIGRLHQTHGMEMLGIPTRRLRSLDERLCGWRGLMLLSAKPGVGKTTLGLFAAVSAVAADERVSAVIVSYEMSRESMLLRLLAMASGLSWRSLVLGERGAEAGDDGLRLTPASREKFRQGVADLRSVKERLTILTRQETGDLDDIDRIADAIEEFQRGTGTERTFTLMDNLQAIPLQAPAGGWSDGLDRDRTAMAQLMSIRDRLGDRDPLLVISERTKQDFNRGGMEGVLGTGRNTYATDVVMAMLPDQDENGQDVIVHDPIRGDYTTIKLQIEKGRDGVQRGTERLRFYFDSSEFVSEADAAHRGGRR